MKRSILKISKFTLITLKMILTDKKALFKFFSGFLLLLFPFLTFWSADDITIFPAIINGFILITPFIDYTFYISRHKNNYQNFLINGFKHYEIILAKSLVIFFTAIITILLNIIFMLILDNLGFILLKTSANHLFIFLTCLPALFSLILLEGILQAYGGFIFIVRTVNMLLFILNTHYMQNIKDFLLLSDRYKILIINLFLTIILIFILLTLKKEWLIKTGINNE